MCQAGTAREDWSRLFGRGRDWRIAQDSAGIVVAEAALVDHVIQCRFVRRQWIGNHSSGRGRFYCWIARPQWFLTRGHTHWFHISLLYHLNYVYSICYAVGMDRVVIIGGGVGGLAAACLLGKAGYDVTVLEKNGQLGGRAGQLQAKGFTFDTGPSWFLMPEVFARFFARLGERLEDHLQLERLSPGYRLVYPDGERLDITGNLARDAAAFDALEPGAGQRLARYLLQAGQTYHTVLDHFLYTSYDQASDMLHPRLWPARTLPWHSTMQRQAAHYFRDPRLQQAITLPSLFLGTDPAHTPAIYNLLNHSLFSGVSYPRGGMYELVRTLRRNPQDQRQCRTDFDNTWPGPRRAGEWQGSGRRHRH